MLKKEEIKMIHKWLREGMIKSVIARRLGISREPKMVEKTEVV